MNRLPSLVLRTACAAAVAACAAAASAQVLNPPAARITDEAIHADYQTYVDQQARIKALNDSGKQPVRTYAVAKAQCWLDVSFHEYSRNDRSAFVQQALTESYRITEFLSKGGKVTDPQNPALATPLVNDAATLRPDLWAQAAALKQDAGWPCAQQQVACAEVELVHAGNEYNQQQWRHAKPYVQIAEDAIAQASEAARQCVAGPVVPLVTAAPAPAPVPVLQEASLQAEVVFAFDRSDLRAILPASLDQLEALVRRLKDGKFTLVSIRLVGFADRLNGTGQGDYNKRLSERRVATVRDLLVARGIPAARVDVAARGDEAQVEACTGKFASVAALQACLLPNRRVEVRVKATRDPAAP